MNYIIRKGTIMNQANEENNVLEDNVLKSKKKIGNTSVKFFFVYMIVIFILGRIPYMNEHEIISGIISTGIFLGMGVKLMNKVYESYLIELISINEIDVEEFKKAKERYILLHEAGHVEKFNIFKTLLDDTKKMIHFYIVWICLVYISGDYNSNNLLLSVLLFMPILGLRVSYKKWIDDGTIEIMGIKREDLEDAE